MVCSHLRSLICAANGTRARETGFKMEYKGKTIHGYKGHLASYKATIGIALSTSTLYVELINIQSFIDIT